MNDSLILLLLCLSLRTIEGTGVMDKVETMQELAASLCPNQVCNSTLNETEKLDSCCQRCSCAPDCYKVASCCPDSLLNEPTEPEYPCIDLTKYSNAERGIDYGTLRRRSYRLVNKCPDDKTTQAEAHGCTNPSSLKDYIPVSDFSYNMVFRNWHCAKCHGVFNYIPWYLSVYCESLALAIFETFEERNEYILKHCPFVPIPPNHDKADLSHCYTESPQITVRNKCNISGKWDYYDQHLETACSTKRSYQNTIYTELFSTSMSPIYFSNVYCFMCNNPRHFNRLDICKNRDTSFKSKFKFVRFVAVVQGVLEESTPVESTSDVKRCGSMDIWDPFEAACRRVHCPMGTSQRNGRCKSNWKSSDGFTVSVWFEVVGLKADDIMFHKYFVDSASKAVMEVLGSDFRCGACDRLLYQFKNETNAFLYIPFFTKKSCSVPYLIAKLQGLVMTENIRMKWTTLDQSVTINLKAILKKVDYDVDSSIKFSGMHPERVCISLMQLTYANMNICPRINLTRHKFAQFCLRQTPLKSLLENVCLIGATMNTTSVCVEDYFLLRESMMMVKNGCQQVDVDLDMVTKTLFVLLTYKMYMRF